MPIEPISNPPKNPPKVTDSIVTRYMVAVLAAWTAETATYPMDLTKTRLQIQSEVAAAKHGNKIEHHGMIRTAIQIAKKEGILKLWNGLMPMYQRHAVYSGSRLIIYEKWKQMFGNEKGQVSLVVASLGGMTAGALAQLLANPTDLVKIQMQAEGRRVLQGLPPRFKNWREVYKMLYRESGILGFWRGVIPNIQRGILVNMGHLAAYDYSKQMLISKFGFKDGPLAQTGAGVTAGLVAATLATPADVMKTRIMNQPVGKDGKPLLYKGIIDCFFQSVKNEGFLALYKGFIPIWMRFGPWALINWLAFEKIMNLIGGKSF